MSTDRIEKKILLRAPRTRVWKAISDSAEFGTWFGMKADGPFRAGAVVHCSIEPTQVDPAVAAMQKPHKGKQFDITIEAVEPERLLSFRWHPYAIEEGVDYSKEPTTLIEFTLEDAEGGTLLTVTESGFDRIPAARRAEAFRMNDGGWTQQMGNIATHVAG